jgi:hypothetical protein
VITFFVDFYLLGKDHPEILGRFKVTIELVLFHVLFLLLNCCCCCFEKRKNAFQKYMFDKWKKLKETLRELKNTRSEELYHFVPLINFYDFLEKVTKETGMEITE